MWDATVKMFQHMSTCRGLESVVTTLPKLEPFLSEEQRFRRTTGTVSDGRADDIEQRGNLPSREKKMRMRKFIGDRVYVNFPHP